MLVHRHKVIFLVCGAQKSDTTALYYYLKGHPEIFMASKKEVHFFDKEKYFQDEATNLGENPYYKTYHSLFYPVDGHKILSDFTLVYMYLRSVARRVWEYNPAMKIIVVLRNPIDRAFSHWNIKEQEGKMINFFLMQSGMSRRGVERLCLSKQSVLLYRQRLLCGATKTPLVIFGGAECPGN